MTPPPFPPAAPQPPAPPRAPGSPDRAARAAFGPDRRALWLWRWHRLSAASVRGFHGYANWLVGLTWLRFGLLSVLLMVAAGVLQNVPPFSWSWTRKVQRAHVPTDVVIHLPELGDRPGEPRAPLPAGRAASAPGAAASRGAEAPKPPAREGVEIIIDERGVRIGPRTGASAPAAPPPPAVAASTPSAAASGAERAASGAMVIQVPPGVASEAVKEAIEEARAALEEALQEARQEAEMARTEAQEQREAAREASRQAREAARQITRELREKGLLVETEEVSLGEALPPTAIFWILASLIIKITYKRQIQAEARASQAVETAEAESLRRQVLEARMAAMQAQVEPHFLFNTLASIDHLIEVDPKRASQMQRHLIALLRASMPTMRETSDGGARDLAREMAMVRPYLEILKVRMEERLATELEVPEGLQSAEFPSMMLQTLVENAIKHGLEPKPEGGRLQVKAEIVHGELVVTVADTGIGFGRGSTAGTGVGLANIRERLQLLYGHRAALTIAENPGGGTRVTLRVPYRPVPGAAGMAAA